MRQGLKQSFSLHDFRYLLSLGRHRHRIRYIQECIHPTPLVKYAIASSAMTDFKSRIEKTNLIWHEHIGLLDSVIRIFRSFHSSRPTFNSFILLFTAQRHATSSCPSPKHQHHQHGIAKWLAGIRDLTRFRCYSLSLSLLGTRPIPSYHSSSLHAMPG